ncbi:PRC-barrel domain-containing protein [Conexibacter arvalis]|uniref:Sporulation protein YlmC with PRC-barrel domain n=1 Tax=Conexibacter arvalis TaxID=912552 RepID=A0A840I7G8_9ACTN|nr:PRC-barrel domain-containing protein [Conexibacter arvalis]MBB4660836.1 sporulation protein YlmC with PRC-barrel domain [Conexibacter arvalis]
MHDLGDPIAYLVLQPGTDVYDAAGERVGRVEHVLFDDRTDVFDGIVVDTRAGPGGLRFADADQVDELYERGVVLKVAASALHDPEPGPGVIDADAADGDASPLTEKLRRAWDWISGRY